MIRGARDDAAGLAKKMVRRDSSLYVDSGSTDASHRRPTERGHLQNIDLSKKTGASLQATKEAIRRPVSAEEIHVALRSLALSLLDREVSGKFLRDLADTHQEM